jgi:hypothetical protein
LFLTLGAGPILVDTEKTGQGVIWDKRTIVYNPETGDEATLGRLSNQEARDLLKEHFEDWKAVTLGGKSVVDFSAIEGAGLGAVDQTNAAGHFSYCPPDETCASEEAPFVLGSARSGKSPILFDDDGKITDLVQGGGARLSIIGFAGPRVVERVDGILVITEGQAVLNGLFIDCHSLATASDPCKDPEVSEQEFEGAVFHEIGHFLGLDHTQVNLSSAVKALSGDKSELDGVPTLFPLLIDGAAQRSPHFDDIVSLASLYPSGTFLSDF